MPILEMGSEYMLATVGGGVRCLFWLGTTKTHTSTHTQMFCSVILTPYADLETPRATTVCAVRFMQGQSVG